jgi:hypothetical protein
MLRSHAGLIVSPDGSGAAALIKGCSARHWRSMTSDHGFHQNLSDFQAIPVIS